MGTDEPDLAHTVAIGNYLGCVVFGIVAGAAVNLFGMRLTTVAGLACAALVLLTTWAAAYFDLFPLWAVGLLAFILTSGSSAFMAAMGSCLVLYPTEAERSRYLTIFFIISNLGGVVGAALAMGLNWTTSGEASGGLSWSSYLALCSVTVATILVGTGICEISDTVRSDKSEIVPQKKSIKDELDGLKQGLLDRNLWFLAPLFTAGIWHEVFLYSWVNGKVFNIRSRAINSGLYYVSRIFSTFLFEGVSKRNASLHSRVCGCVALTAGIVAVGSVCICFLVFQVGGLEANGEFDVTSPAAAPLLIAFLAYGALETVGSALVYWLIGVLPFDDPAVVPRYAGWYRMFGALGATISWCLDLKTVVPYPYQFLITTLLWGISLGLVLRLALRVRNQARCEDEKLDSL
eukprot:Gregarina_sp_Pseudo_9__5967@NODE_974_length_2012_cov_40_475925_g913_i0_p1_GENE_NODE_974_length_2012_cov_40_475925_g913_i0NODE_974_length_2012_cov_40_475925_g913_i0_p1_ORF_typecomplete_len404_score87_65MFS_1/PF07690_16/6_3e14MFS_1/PF07690_16/1_2e03UNC93/PF05978_16/1_5e09UNC93/PF05978_16/3_3e03UNC93/PF05978_16/4_3e03MFS_2/PF13347_6/19MFS_2/PF13347_6/5_5e06MFS_2/PF13347_6/1_2e03Nodulinlike/PF06813_13/0_0014Nodulinlike/PF06813_13/2e03MFS_3/PF05977_13/0_019MFS_3/PF05977_13/1_8e04_NODE_974_length_2012